MNYFMIAGSLIGFVLFVASLESKGMGNIIIRNGEFVPSNILHYMKQAFVNKHLWYPVMLRSNWIVMMSAGASIGYFVSKSF